MPAKVKGAPDQDQRSEKGKLQLHEQRSSGASERGENRIAREDAGCELAGAASAGERSIRK